VWQSHLRLTASPGEAVLIGEISDTILGRKYFTKQKTRKINLLIFGS